jgi:hypothetical protein
MKLRAFAFGSDRDWSAESQVSLNIDQHFSKGMSYNWTRTTALGAEQSDLIVAFQRTPADRWAPVDIRANPAAQGQLNSGEGLRDEMKVMFVRTTRDADHKVQSAVGYFRGGAVAESTAVSDFPAALTGTSLSNTTVSWDPISSPGWMAVVRSTDAKEVATLPEFRLFDLGLRTLATSSSLEAWVNPSEGVYDLVSPLGANEHLSLVYVGSVREVPAPSITDAQDPLLFTYASELRMAKVK